MTAIWRNDGDGWSVSTPTGFADEAELHRLVEEVPELLPLAGSPGLVVIGREVPLAAGFADLIAVETTGRLVVVEVKLAKNSEARRAVVAQVLTYAASLRGMSRATLEATILSSQLAKAGAESIADAVGAANQTGSFDREGFEAALDASLRTGAFRLVLVLDDAPSELVRLVSYLQSMIRELLIDLVTVAAYEVGGSRVLVPQRVEGEPEPLVVNAGRHATAAKGELTEGAETFANVIAGLRGEPALTARRLLDWAVGLERGGLARLLTYRGVSQTALLPYVAGEKVGLVTIWNGPALSVWRSVFERRAVQSLPAVEQAVAPKKVGQGNNVTPSVEVLAAIRRAYAEAVGRPPAD